jgi:hypothetical protein
VRYNAPPASNAKAHIISVTGQPNTAIAVDNHAVATVIQSIAVVAFGDTSTSF